MKRALLLWGCLAVSGCAAWTPPPGWQQGGAPLFVPRATWNAGATSVELLQDGRVLVNGAWSFSIDRAGRVFDADSQPVAMLRTDGRLVGSSNVDMGTVGATSAAPPGSRYATLAIAPDGSVLHYGDDSDMHAAGAWVGCGLYPPALQACMLVTYMVTTRFQPYRSVNNYPGSPYGSPIMPGFGLGVP